MFKYYLLSAVIVTCMLMVGCSFKSTADESLIQQYTENKRIDKYYELKKEYDDNLLILLINTKEDHTVINSVINFFSWILPSLPTTCATGGVLAILYFAMWWTCTTLCGGAILGALAFLGGMAGGIPGIPPAIMGIIFLCLMFSILETGCSAILG